MQANSNKMNLFSWDVVIILKKRKNLNTYGELVIISLLFAPSITFLGVKMAILA